MFFLWLSVLSVSLFFFFYHSEISEIRRNLDNDFLWLSVLSVSCFSIHPEISEILRNLDNDFSVVFCAICESFDFC